MLRRFPKRSVMNLTSEPRTYRAFFGGMAGVALLLCLGNLDGLHAQPTPADPVERLRTVLRCKTDEAPVREQKLRECVQAVRTFGDLRRAAALAEWKDQAAVDLAQRKVIIDRFLVAMRERLRS